MALLPKFYLDAVVSIGVGNLPRHWIGTGFLYGALNKENGNYFIFLITNKHVLENEKEIWLKFNSASDSSSEDFRVALHDEKGVEQWIRHPRTEIDLGAILINVNFLNEKKMKYHFIACDKHSYTVNQLKENDVTEGDGVYLLGYPMGLVNPNLRAAICRSGCIARIQDVLSGKAEAFLVDGQVFPGNSGGPVILQPTMTTISGTKNVSNANLIGVVESYITYQDTAVSLQTSETRIIFSENSGLTSVIPVDRLNELMDFSLARFKGQ